MFLIEFPIIMPPRWGFDRIPNMICYNHAPTIMSPLRGFDRISKCVIYNNITRWGFDTKMNGIIGIGNKNPEGMK